MTTKSIAILLQSRGHQLSYSVRADGGIRITEIDGRQFKLSEGNDFARQLAGKPQTSSALSQRVKARINIDKHISKYLAKQKGIRMQSTPIADKAARKEVKAKIKMHREAESFQEQRERQRKKWLKQYQKEQEQYKKRREQGRSAQKALRKIKKVTKTGRPVSPTAQHAKFVEAKRKARSEEFGHIRQVLDIRKAVDTKNRMIAARTAGFTQEQYQARIDLDREAKSALYDYEEVARTEEERTNVYKIEIMPTELKVRTFLESLGLKATKQNITDIFSFLWEQHKTKLWKPLNDAYQKGAVYDSDIRTIKDGRSRMYATETRSGRDELAKQIIDFIKSII